MASAMLGIAALLVLPSPTAIVVTCIGASLIFDRVDGAVARRLGVTSLMGAQLDSLADLLAFGVLPAALVIRRYPNGWIVAAALAYCLAAVWRLARYEEAELRPGRWGETFQGVPTPAAAATLVVTALSGNPWIEGSILLLMAVLMPSNLRYPKRGIGAWPWMVLVPLAVAAHWWAA